MVELVCHVRGEDPSGYWAGSWWWNKPGANPGMKLCRMRSQPGTCHQQSKMIPNGEVAVLGSSARDTLRVAASVPSAAGCLPAFQRERGFLTPVTFTSWAAALEPGVCVCLFFHCVLAVVSSSPLRSMSVACLL